MLVIKDIFRISLITIFIIILIELFLSFLIFFNTNKIDIFSYGFNKNINFTIIDLSKLNFSIWKSNYVSILKNDLAIKDDLKNSIEIWTFGGSTTEGKACGSNNTADETNSSSWPEELSKKDKRIRIKNFGKSGSYTDWAIDNLIKNINVSDIKPNIILWANLVNEVNVISYGLKRNKEILNFKFSENKRNIILDRLNITLKKNFLIHNFFHHIYYKILEYYGYNFNPYFGHNIESLESLYKEDVKVALQNYKINTEEAIKLSKIHDIEFYIVTLIYKDLIEKRKYFLEIYEDYIKKIKKNENINWIDTRKLKSKFEENKFLNIEKIFCDNIHKTLDGNILVASRIYEFLNSNSDFFSNK